MSEWSKVKERSLSVGVTCGDIYIIVVAYLNSMGIVLVNNNNNINYQTNNTNTTTTNSLPSVPYIVDRSRINSSWLQIELLTTYV